MNAPSPQSTSPSRRYTAALVAPRRVNMYPSAVRNIDSTSNSCPIKVWNSAPNATCRIFFWVSQCEIAKSLQSVSFSSMIRCRSLFISSQSVVRCPVFSFEVGVSRVRFTIVCTRSAITSRSSGMQKKSTPPCRTHSMILEGLGDVEKPMTGAVGINNETNSNQL